MMDDKDDSIPDPWAGIDDEPNRSADDGFSFSFESTPDDADRPAVEEAESVIGFGSPSPADDDEPVIRIDAASDADPFASLSLDAGGEAESDRNGDQDDLGEVAAWLDEPETEPERDAPLAIFPPDSSAADEAAASEHEAPVDDGSLVDDGAIADRGFFGETPAFDDDPGFGATPSFGGVSEADDLHQAGDVGGAAGSSHVEVGTGMSGVVSESEIDPTSDVAAVDDWAEVASRETTFEDFSAADQPAFEASGFDTLSDSGDAGQAGLSESVSESGVGTLATTAAIAATAAPGSPRPTRAKGGGLGQIVGIVLGGLLAIPITYAILIWGFQRDPFKLTKMLPEQVAFLLPQKFRAGGSGKVSRPKLDAVATLDDLPAAQVGSEAATTPVEPAKPVEVPATTEPPTDPAVPPSGTPANPPPEAVAAATMPAVSPPPAAVPQPEPLDMSALESAIGEATTAFEELAAADAESPERRKLLVGWYKRLADVAEQLVLLEKVAGDTGQSLDGAVGGIAALGEAVAADPAIEADLAKLSGMWLSSRKRPADGTVLLATFEGVRQVGPYWSARVTVNGPEPRSVAVISRLEPRAEPGDAVLVTGVLFDGDVVWAADCRPISQKAAAAEDIF